MAFSNGYDYRRSITVDNTKVSAAATDFPILVSETIADLADTANGGKVESSNGDDIRFELQAWNVVTSYQASSTDISTNVGGAEAVFFKDDGTRMYVADYNNPSSVEEYLLSTAWDITTKTHNASLDVSGNEFTNTSIYIGDGGTKLFIGGDSSVSVWMYDLSTPWDLSTASYTNGNTFDVSTQASVIYGFDFKPDGTKFYIGDGSNGEIHQYDMSTPWDVTTASHVSSNYIGAEAGAIDGVRFHPNGDLMYVMDQTRGVMQFSLTTAWASSTASYDSKLRGGLGSGVGLYFHPDGDSFFYTETTTVYKYTMHEKLDHEIDKYANTTGELISHIRIPFLDASQDAEIDMYYGNSAVVSPEENPNGVWHADYMSVFHLKDEGGTPIAEYRTQVLSDSIDSGHVASPTFENTYTDPVVIPFMATFYGGQACGVRAKNVTSTGCDIFMQEPDNEAHTSERLYYMVMEKGVHTLPGGAQVEAGVVSTSSVHRAGTTFGGVTVSFTSAFPSTPAVFHGLNTYANSDFMETVAHNVTTADFQVEQEAGGSGSASTTEDIAWIAIEPTVQAWFEVGISTATANCGVDDTPHTISYTNNFSVQPNIIVKGNSGNGADGYWARAAANYDGSAANNDNEVTVYAEEDQVEDLEQGHSAETFAFMAFNKYGGYIFDASDALTDSTGNHQGHMAGKPEFVSGQIHEALSLTVHSSGHDTFLDTQHAYTPDFNTTLTFSGWFKFDDLDNSYTMFGERGSAASGTRVTLLGDVAGDPIRFTLFGIASYDSADPGLTVGAWHHIAVTYDQSNVRFYVDGTELSSFAETSAMNTSSNHPMFIGALDNIGKPSSSSRADIDESRILKSAITGDWITTEYNNQNDPSTFYTVGSEEFPSVTISHTSDVVLRKANTIAHTSDGVLRSSQELTHTSDSILRASPEATHTSDSVLRGQNISTHTSDAVIRSVKTTQHTSDAILRATQQVTYTSDAFLSTKTEVSHTSDAVLRAVATITHTSDAELHRALSLNFSSDAVVRGAFEVTHTSDSKLKATNEVTHTSDALITRAFTLTHTSDSVLRTSSELTFTSDSKLKASATATHTSDASLKGVNTVTHTSDALISLSKLLTHTSDAILHTVVEKTYTSDAILRAGLSVSYTSDGILKVADYNIVPITYVRSDASQVGVQQDTSIAGVKPVSPMLSPMNTYEDIIPYPGDDPLMDSPDYTMDDPNAIMGFDYDRGDKPSIAGVQADKPNIW